MTRMLSVQFIQPSLWPISVFCMYTFFILLVLLLLYTICIYSYVLLYVIVVCGGLWTLRVYESGFWCSQGSRLRLGLRWSKPSASYSTCSRAARGTLKQESDFTDQVRFTRCVQRTERNGGFGFQTNVKDRFLNQSRWTCWYSCRKKTYKSCQQQTV